MMKPLVIDNFMGGMTDYYIDAPLTKYRVADNLLITKLDSGKAKLYTRPGSLIWDAVNYQIPAGNQRVGALRLFGTTMLVSSANKIYYVNSTWQTLTGPTGNNVFPSTVTAADTLAFDLWNGHMLTCTNTYQKPQKMYRDSGNVLRVRTAGMPDLASSPVVTPTGNTGKSYIYDFLYAYTYTVGQKTFIDRGPITEVLVTNADAPEVNANNITAIPVLANGATDNYDTASSNLVVEIYRSTDGGDELFFVGSVPNGTTTFSDTLSDTLLQDNEPIYTTGDVVENDPPPPCKTLCVTQQFAYYGNVKIAGQELTNFVYQSQINDIDSVPLDFSLELDDEVVQLTSYREVPIVLCKQYTYRIESGYDELGRGGMIPQKISDTAGCVSYQSAVRTELGVFWFGVDGVYHTDGYQVTKVNKSMDKTYATFIDTTSKALAQVRVQGKYDSKNKRVYWTVWSNAGNSDVDQCYVLDLNYGISDDMPFTTTSGLTWSPTALEFQGKYMYRGDKRGFIFKHEDTVFSDPKVELLTNPSIWNVEPIIYNYVSVAFNMGMDAIRKYAPRVNCNVANDTNTSLQIISINDDGKRTADLAVIRYRNNITWGDPDVYWGDPALVWNQGGLGDFTRRFPAKNLRFTYKQLQLTNAYVAILNSDLIGSATTEFLSAVTKTVTLDQAASYDWPTKAVDYYIAFSADNYTNQYLITARTDNVLTISDPVGYCPYGSFDWVIRGIPKDETLNLISYTIQFVDYSETQQAFFKSQSGEVGAMDLA